MPLSTGQLLNNRYRIVNLLGQGGFGAVYRAWDINLSRPCALKENLDTSAEAKRQFEREAIILAGLSHVNLPRVTDHFFIPDQGQYLVMDFIEGDDSQQILQRSAGVLPQAQVLQWIEQVCDALIYLHSQNPPIIHRDIKPANIKITPQGKAMLVDFGIAKQYHPDIKTTVGARAITSGYSPPEQYGRGITDAQSDVYALGATLYTLLTGQTPADSVDIMAQNVPQPLPARQLNPAVSPHVDTAIRQAMELEKSRRPRSVADFKVAISGQLPATDHLLQVQGQSHVLPGSAAPAYTRAMPGVYPVGRTSSKDMRTRSWVWPGVLAGAVVLAGIIVLALVLWAIFGRGSTTAASLSATQTANMLAYLLATPRNTPQHLASPEVPPSDIPLQPTVEEMPSATYTPMPPPATATMVPSPSFTPPPSIIPPLTFTPTPGLPAAIIEPYCSMFKKSPQYVRIGQPVILWWRWDAKTRQQVEDHLAAATYEIYLDGMPVEAERMSDIEYLSNEKYFRMSWYATVGVLSPGKHRAERYLSWTRMISDGWETFGPGGKTETESHYCDIIVQ